LSFERRGKIYVTTSVSDPVFFPPAKNPGSGGVEGRIIFFSPKLDIFAMKKHSLFCSR